MLFNHGKVTVRHSANAPVERSALDNALNKPHPYSNEEEEKGIGGHLVERI